jgi:hypothetical protein
MMRAVQVVLAVAFGVWAGGCSSASNEGSAAPVGTAPAASVTLEPAWYGIPPESVELAIPRDAAQVGVRLKGDDLIEVDQMIAEVAPANHPDQVKRWRVDAPVPVGDDGAKAMVTLPPHAVPDGEYILTLWEGDARVVARYAFRTAKK